MRKVAALKQGRARNIGGGLDIRDLVQLRPLCTDQNGIADVVDAYAPHTASKRQTTTISTKKNKNKKTRTTNVKVVVVLVGGGGRSILESTWDALAVVGPRAC